MPLLPAGVQSVSGPICTYNVHFSFFLTVVEGFFLFLRFYVFIFRKRGREGRKRGREINVWLPLGCPLLGTWPATQACALTGNQTSDPLLHSPALNPLSHASQGITYFFPLAYFHWSSWKFKVKNLGLNPSSHVHDLG